MPSQKKVKIPASLPLPQGRLIQANLYSIVTGIMMGSAIIAAGRLEAALAGERPLLSQEPPFEAEGLGQVKATVPAMGAEGGWDEVAPGASPFSHNHSSKSGDRQDVLAQRPQRLEVWMWLLDVLRPLS